ncbi:MAG TPA: ABC transporter permease [Symbiobacteriaceae bacterium]|nr:ABC transporter permease [Symbiobacteriaceae bacterium]
MKRYLLRRVVQLIPLFFIVTTMTYGLYYLAPGGPESIFLAGEESNVRPEDIEALRQKWGLDQPFHVQYGKWLGNLVLHGDLGRSFTSQRPVTETWLQRLPATLQLNLVEFVLIFLIAIPLGIVCAVRQYSWVDYTASTFSFLGHSMPSFWIGLMLIVFVALPSHGVIPTSGYQSPDVTPETHTALGIALDRLKYMFLPVLTLTITGLAALTRYMRNSMLEVLKEDYIRTARAKGVAERVVIYKHAMRNALLPIITIAGTFLAFLFDGSAITEMIFAWPGVGQYGLQAVSSRDYPVTMALLIFSFILTTVASFTTDVVYVWVDPRIRYS